MVGADRQELVQRHREGDARLGRQRAQAVRTHLQEVVEVDQPHLLLDQNCLELAPDVGRGELVEVVVARLVADQRELAVRAEQQARAILGGADGDEDRVGADPPQALVERVGGDLRPALADRGVGVGDDGDRAAGAEGCGQPVGRG